jgi:hypothetical protein
VFWEIFGGLGPRKEGATGALGGVVCETAREHSLGELCSFLAGETNEHGELSFTRGSVVTGSVAAQLI